MTKSEFAIVATIGTSVVVNQLAHAAALNDSSLPIWLTIAGVLGMPFVGLCGILATFLHVSKKVDTVKDTLKEEVKQVKTDVVAEVHGVEIQINHKMDALLELTAKAAFAEGLKQGRLDLAAEIAKLDADEHVRSGLRAEGAAAALLSAAQAPLALPAPPDPVDPPVKAR